MSDQPPESLFLKHAQYIGFITIISAWIELMVDGVDALILEKLGGDALKEPLPQATNRKIAFLTKAYRRLPLLAPYKEELATLIGRLRWLRDRRNDLIHGAMRSAPNQAVIFNRILHHEAGAPVDEKTYSEVDMVVTMKMALETFGLAFALVQRMAVDLLDEVPEGFRKVDVRALLARVEAL